MDALRPDTIIGRRYRVVRELGRGGMGVVYEVEHVNTKERLALKLLVGAARFDEGAVARFRREARVSAMIGSEHIVRVIDADIAPELDDAPFLVMELLHGENLEERVVAGGAVPPAEVASILGQIGEALEKAHRIGIVHRDLKPENLFLHRRPDGVVIAKVLDFGISKFLPATDMMASAARTYTGSVLGTPLYMAPEQAHGENEKITPATDVWALGLIALRLLTAQQYWQAPTLAKLIVQIVSDPIVPPSERFSDNPHMSPALDAWFLRSCHRDEGARWPSALAQVRALAQVVGTSETPLSLAETARSDFPEARGPGPDVQTPLAVARTKRPRRTIDRGVIAGAVVACVAASALIVVSRRGRDQAAQKAETDAAPAPRFTTTEGVLACPILDSSGTREPGWLGAAAAEYACRRAAEMLGGRFERVLSPAALLALPRQPTEDFPEDPYRDPQARNVSVTAARAAAAVYLDGRIAKRDHEFEIRFSLERANGEEIGQSSASGPDLYSVVGKGLDGLVSAGALPKAAKLDPEVARWRTFDDVDVAMFMDHFALVSDLLPPDELCADAATQLPRMGRAANEIFEFCPDLRTEPPTFDRSSLAGMAYSLASLPANDAPGVLEQFRKARATEQTALGRSVLLQAEAIVLGIQGDRRASELGFRSALLADPGDPDSWRAFFGAPTEQTSFAALHGGLAWVPSSPHIPLLNRDAPFAWRAFELLPSSFSVASEYSRTLARRADVDGLRNVAEGLADQNKHGARAKLLVLAILDRVEARFGSSSRRIARLMDEDALEDLELEVVFEFAVINCELLEDRASADRWVLRYAERAAQSVRRETYLWRIFPALAMRASPDIGIRALRAIRSNISEETVAAFYDGAIKLLQGNARGAANAWRPVLSDYSIKQFLPSSVFASLGETELVRGMDENGMNENKATGGIALRTPVAARHAFARGEKAHAKELAQKVLDAWSRADCEVPALADMRAIIAAK